MNNIETIKKTLREQLQLLAERSKKTTKAEELLLLTKAMGVAARQLIYAVEKDQPVQSESFCFTTGPTVKAQGFQIPCKEPSK